jgi:hypothetical protein
MATLGPTVREFSMLEREKTSESRRIRRESPRRLRERAESRKRATKRGIASQRIPEFESRLFEGSRVESSRVREFESSRVELDSGVIPTVKSETNKESGN